ncbi:hypothetical protein G3M48_006909 [Beauveria asiatica]|uniref:Metalloprotease-like protein n=1 Tax=Beauveria asiatica TaxID=1069075 RepID=A0AAW0S5P8_9HYPO
MSDKEIEDLKKQLREAKAREEEAKARAEDERRKNQKTTLTEYLHNCHSHLYQNLKLADASKSSTGLATSVDGRFYPRWLRPWKTDTERQHQQQFEDIRGIYGEERLFHEQSTTINIGATFIRKKAGNEKAVEYFEKSAVEEPTWNILEPIWKRKQLRQRYQCADLRFTDNIRDFRDESDDTQATMINITPAITRPKLKPDGGGIRKDLHGKESVAFVYDYKAAHKFSVKHLEAALAKETLFVDVHEWVLREQCTRDPELLEQEQAEARIAMALIQVFNYMLSYAVDYGFVTAGKSLVQLTYDRAEPLVLRWRLCIPNNVEAQGPGTTEAHISQLNQTAVAQLASFCLLSLRSTTLTGRSLEEALHHANLHLKIWKVTSYKDPTTPPESDGTASQSASSSQDPDKTFVSDETASTNKYTLRSRASCKDATVPPQTRDDDEGGDGDKRGGAESPQRGVGSSSDKQGQGSNKRKYSGSKNPASAFTRQYCTQACLLGLKHGHQLDRRCPNVLSHDVEGNGRHSLDAIKFTQLMAKQLREAMYEIRDLRY